MYRIPFSLRVCVRLNFVCLNSMYVAEKKVPGRLTSRWLHTHNNFWLLSFLRFTPIFYFSRLPRFFLVFYFSRFQASIASDKHAEERCILFFSGRRAVLQFCR